MSKGVRCTTDENLNMSKGVRCTTDENLKLYEYEYIEYIDQQSQISRLHDQKKLQNFVMEVCSQECHFFK